MPAGKLVFAAGNFGDDPSDQSERRHEFTSSVAPFPGPINVSPGAEGKSLRDLQGRHPSKRERRSCGRRPGECFGPSFHVVRTSRPNPTSQTGSSPAGSRWFWGNGARRAPRTVPARADGIRRRFLKRDNGWQVGATQAATI